MDAASEQTDELFDCESCLSDDCPECSLGHLAVIGDYEATVWRTDISENHVAPSLAVELVAESPEG